MRVRCETWTLNGQVSQACYYFSVMSRKSKTREEGALYFVTFPVINWLDIFIRKEYKDIFLDSIRYCNKGLVLHHE
jgi:hypothetical protein